MHSKFDVQINNRQNKYEALISKNSCNLWLMKYFYATAVEIFKRPFDEKQLYCHQLYNFT